MTMNRNQMIIKAANSPAVTTDEALRVELDRTRWALQQTRAELDKTRAFLACVRTQLGSERSRRLAELRTRRAKRPGPLTRLWDSITIFCAGLQMALRNEN